MKKIKLLTAFLFITISVLLCFCINTFAADLPAPFLRQQDISSDSITLKWNKIDGAYAYKVYVFDKNADSFVSLGSTRNTFFFADELKSETTYTFIVKPFVLDKKGNKDFGEKSNEFTATTELGTVENITLEKATTSAIKIKWNKVNGAVKYKVKYCPAGSDEYLVAGETKKEHISISNLEGSKKYKIRIAAIGKESNSPYSNAFCFYCTPGKADKPKLVSADNRSIKISWNKVKTADKYYIYVSSKENGTYKLIGTSKGNSYTYSINKPEQICYFRVAAVIDTKDQTTAGKKSDALKASTKPIQISGPTSARCGEHPIISAGYYDSKVRWSTSDSSIIRIKGKDIRACKNGTATVTAEYNGSRASVTITVSSPVLKYMSCVYDYTNSRFIFDSRVNEKCYPASITKLITALTALQYMSLDDVIVVGSELNLVEPLSSRCGIQYGEKFKLGDLLYGLLLPSGGDAAYTIAVNCARKASGNPDMGYVDAKNYFVSLMNQYMTSIGAKGTHLVNPHGYPVNGHYTTVYDLVLVAKKVLANPALKSRTATASKYVVALTGKGRTWTTTNGLINPNSSFYSPYAHGLKTGTVDTDYTGIVSAATKNGRTIITVVNGCESYNARYVATRTLYNYYL